MAKNKEPQNVFAFIEDIIRYAPVHVGIDPSGEMKRYTVVSPDGQKICLDIVPDEENDAVLYMLGSEDETVEYVRVKNRYQTFLPNEERLLNLFRLAASKVAWQETQTIMRMEMGKTVGKNYKN